MRMTIFAASMLSIVVLLPVIHAHGANHIEGSIPVTACIVDPGHAMQTVPLWDKNVPGLVNASNLCGAANNNVMSEFCHSNMKQAAIRYDGGGSVLSRRSVCF